VQFYIVSSLQFLEISDFITLFSCDCLSVYVYVSFAEVYLQISRGCGRVPRSHGGSGWAPVPFVVYPPSCRSGWFHTTELFLRGVFLFSVYSSPKELPNNDIKKYCGHESVN